MLPRIKSFLHNVFSWKYSPLVLAFVVLMLYHQTISLNWADDLWFNNAAEIPDIFNFVQGRYFNWTSRLVIETFLMFFANLNFLFRLVNPLFFILLFYSIYKLFSIENHWFGYVLIFYLVSLMPGQVFFGAGWIATCTNYLWPTSLGLFALIPIKKIFEGKNIKAYAYPFYLLAFIYASNQEQIAICLLLIYSFATIYFYSKKRGHPFLVINTILSFSSLSFILTAPGNSVRKEAEIINWFPDFNSLSIFKKFEIGFSSTMFEFIMTENHIFIFFSLILLIFTFIKHKSILKRLVASIPLISVIVFGYSIKYIESIPSLRALYPSAIIMNIRGAMGFYGTGFNLFSLTSMIPDIIYVFILAAVIFTIFGLFSQHLKAWLTIFTLALGFITRMALSLSPTIWASGQRTFFIMYISFIISIIIILKEYMDSKKRIN